MISKTKKTVGLISIFSFSTSLFFPQVSFIDLFMTIAFKVHFLFDKLGIIILLYVFVGETKLFYSYSLWSLRWFSCVLNFLLCIFIYLVSVTHTYLKWHRYPVVVKRVNFQKFMDSIFYCSMQSLMFYFFIFSNELLGTKNCMSWLKRIVLFFKYIFTFYLDLYCGHSKMYAS